MLRGQKPDIQIPPRQTKDSKEVVKDNKSSKESKETKVFTNDREKGDFKLVVPINSAICVLSDDSPKFLVSQGVVSLIYTLQNNSEDIDFY